MFLMFVNNLKVNTSPVFLLPVVEEVVFKYLG